MYNASEIATKINYILKEKQLSQKDMLESCNLSKNAISSMLSRGSMLRADNLARIADYLDCSIDYLMGRTNSFKVSQSRGLGDVYKRQVPKEKKQTVIHFRISGDG